MVAADRAQARAGGDVQPHAPELAALRPGRVAGARRTGHGRRCGGCAGHRSAGRAAGAAGRGRCPQGPGHHVPRPALTR